MPLWSKFTRHFATKNMTSDSPIEKHVFLVRHGESEENADRIGRGMHATLTDIGKVQVGLVADRIACLEIDHLISSTYVRARETAEAVGTYVGKGPELSELFIEWRAPSHHVNLHEKDPLVTESLYAIHHNHDPHYRHSDEENFVEIIARARRALEFLVIHKGNRLCVVTHMGFMLAMVSVMLFGDHQDKRVYVDMLHHMRHKNTGITHAMYVTGNPRFRPGWHLITWNDQSHLG